MGWLVINYFSHFSLFSLLCLGVKKKKHVKMLNPKHWLTARGGVTNDLDKNDDMMTALV